MSLLWPLYFSVLLSSCCVSLLPYLFPSSLAPGLPHCHSCPLTKPKCTRVGCQQAYLGILPGLPVLFCPAVTAPHLSFLSLSNLCGTISPVGHPTPSSISSSPWTRILTCPSSSLPCCLFGTAPNSSLSFLSSHFILSAHHFPLSFPPSPLYLHALLSGISEHPRSPPFLCACFPVALIPSRLPSLSLYDLKRGQI